MTAPHEAFVQAVAASVLAKRPSTREELQDLIARHDGFLAGCIRMVPDVVSYEAKLDLGVRR